MTGDEMLANLGLRLEDPAGSVFTNEAKLDSLNLGQKSVVNMVDNNYLAELQNVLTGKTVSPGIFEILAVLGKEESLGRINDVLK